MAHPALSQFQAISPVSEFDLNPSHTPHFNKHAHSFLAVTPSGMTLATIGENDILLTATDLDGRVVNSKSDLAFVNAQVFGVLPRPDGCMWLLSRSAQGLFQDMGARPTARFRPSDARANYTQMDLYSPSGEHLAAARLLAFVAGAETPVAAANDEIVLRTEELRGAGVQTLLHFGRVIDGKFSERSPVKLVPSVPLGIPLMLPNGDLVLIDRASGNRLTINPKTKSSNLVRLTNPVPVKAAASDSDYVYLSAAIAF